jgi:hypothetical protein
MAEMGYLGLTREVPLFACVIAAEGVGHAIAAASEQLPDDHHSLWNSLPDAQAAESRAAAIRGAAARSMGVITLAVVIYEVAISP